MLYSRISATARPLARKLRAFYIFPGNFTVTWCRFSLLPLPLAIPASLFSLANSIGESFASCAPTVRKLNERLQLCSPPLQPAMLSPLCLSVCLSPRNCLFYKFIIGTTLRSNCQTCPPLLTEIRFLRSRAPAYLFFRSRVASLLARILFSKMENFIEEITREILLIF